MAQEKKKTEYIDFDEVIIKMTQKNLYIRKYNEYYPLICNGDLYLACFLGQLQYWTDKNGRKGKTLSIYKTDVEFAAELGIKPRRIEELKKKCKNLGFISTGVKQVGGKTITHYLLDTEKILAAIEEIIKAGKDKSGKTDSQDTGTPTPSNGGPDSQDTGTLIQRLHTKNTTKNNLPKGKYVSGKPETKDGSDSSLDEAATDKYDLTGLLQQEQEILDYWNYAAKDISGIMKHRGLTSKVCSTNKKPLEPEKQLHEHITAALERYSSVQLKEAIGNYAAVLSSPDLYFYDAKFNLAQFLHFDKVAEFLDSAKPLEKYRRGFDKELDEIEVLRQSFSPVTKTWDKSKTFDMERKTGYGFSFKDIDAYESKLSDMIFVIKEYGEKSFFAHVGYLRELEYMIAGLLFHRKRLEKEYFEENFKICMTYWNKYKEIFAESAEKMKTNSID